MSETADLVKKIKLDPAVVKLSKLLEERRTLVGNLNAYGIRRILLSKDSRDSTKLKLIETTKQIELLALKG